MIQDFKFKDNLFKLCLFLNTQENSTQFNKTILQSSILNINFLENPEKRILNDLNTLSELKLQFYSKDNGLKLTREEKLISVYKQRFFFF